MKTFVLIVSKHFPSTHSRKEDPTYFREKIWSMLVVCSDNIYEEFGGMLTPKIHTIRANYTFWKKRIEQVQAGEAVLSIRYWSGKPYNSPQIVICQLDKNDKVGIQALFFESGRQFEPFVSSEDSESGFQTYLHTPEIAKNDGLSYDDFNEWFQEYDLTEPMAIIHFTKFRY